MRCTETFDHPVLVCEISYFNWEIGKSNVHAGTGHEGTERE
jgi:hypothetical protein